MENLRRDNETQIAYHRRRLAELKEVRQPWEAEWRALAEHIEPTRLRLHSGREGPRSRDKIIDSTGTHAYETLKSGMHSGLTSPARPWFRLTTFDPDLKKQDSVKVYLAAVQDKMREVFAASNLYRAFHIGYGDLGQFGQSVAILVEDEETVIRVQQLVHGRFWLARDHKGKATTLYRTFRWSVQRIIERFGYDNVPERLRSLYDSSKYGECFDVYHAIEPRYDRDPRLIDKRNKAFLSNYWIDELGGDLLEESGFDSNPIIAPAWELSEDDHYALSPGQKALGDIRMLQLEQTRKLEGIDKKVRPPMNAPTSMQNSPASLLPGAVNYVDDPTGKGGEPQPRGTARRHTGSAEPHRKDLLCRSLLRHHQYGRRAAAQPVRADPAQGRAAAAARPRARKRVRRSAGSDDRPHFRYSGGTRRAAPAHQSPRELSAHASLGAVVGEE